MRNAHDPGRRVPLLREERAPRDGRRSTTEAGPRLPAGKPQPQGTQRLLLRRIRARAPREALAVMRNAYDPGRRVPLRREERAPRDGRRSHDRSCAAAPDWGSRDHERRCTWPAWPSLAPRPAAERVALCRGARCRAQPGSCTVGTSALFGGALIRRSCLAREW